MQRRFWDDLDPIERKARRVFAFLGDDDRKNALERDDLPVDVQHLRFQKRRAIAGDDRGRCHVERSRDISDCCLLTIRDSSASVGMTKHLKEDLEELDALPFSRFRVDDDALRGRAVLGGRHRVEHLERIPATDCSRDYSLNLGSL